jgi:outer membrane protein assembly factor BamB
MSRRDFHRARRDSRLWAASAGGRSGLVSPVVNRSRLNRTVVNIPTNPPGWPSREQEELSMFLYTAGTNGEVHKVDLETGDNVWVFDAFGNECFRLAIDSQGNVYATSNDETLRKIDPDGNQIWSETYATYGLRGVAVDSEDNVYVGVTDPSVRKLDPDGNEIWKYETGTSGAALSIRVDGNDDIYLVTGFFDRRVRKLDSDKTELWDYSIGANPTDVAVGPAGVVFQSGLQSNASLRKLTSAGAEDWTYDSGDNATACAADGDGNSYVGNATDGEVRKVNSSGTMVWTNDTSHSTTVNALALDPDGNIYTGSGDSTAKKLDPDGDQVWSYNHGSALRDVAVGLG